MMRTSFDHLAPRSSSGLDMKTTQDVNNAVRLACIAGVIAGGMLLFSAWMTGQRTGYNVSALFGLFSGAVMIGLAYGLTRYSRACAVALLLLYTGGKLAVVLTQTGRVSVLTGILAVAFVYAFVRGVQGTFAHHVHKTQFAKWEGEANNTIDPRLFED